MENDKLNHMEVYRIVDEYSRGHKLEDSPEFKYPFATRRIVGRTWPGDARRKMRKTLQRKEMRK